MALLRRRLRFTFWLDLKKSDELDLAEHILDLKEKRLFAKTIRDGIRLILDLRQGRVEVLRELFPWVLEQATPAEVAPPPPPEDSSISAIKAQMEALTDLLLKQGAVPIKQGEKVYQEAPRALEQTLADKMEITHSKTEDRWGDAKGRHNLLLGLNADDPQKWDNLPTDTFEYGLEMGKFPARLVLQAQQRLQERQQKSGNAKKMAGADQDLPPPALDDLEVLLLETN